MPIEVRRFGAGHRRPEGPPGSTGIEARVIESRASGLVAELAFARASRLAPHASPRTTLFIVIEGGGWVGVGDERARVVAGEAAIWPPDVLHAAWTDGAPMRALVVELADDPRLIASGDGGGSSVGAPERRVPGVTRGEGRLAARPDRRRPETGADEPE